MVQDKDRAHAILSPSFLHIALLCSGAVGLKEQLPPEPPGPQAVKGSIIHDAAAVALGDLLEHKISGADPDIRTELLTDPETKKIARAWRDIVWEKAFEKSVTGKVYGIEERLTLNEKYSIWGTADFWMVSHDERAKAYGMVCDLKTGYVFVEADENSQLAAYACALRNEVRKESGGKKDLDYVRAAIFQPYGDGEKFREVKFTAKQLDNWEKKFYKLAEQVFSGKAKFKAGEHCRYCPAGKAKGVCKANDDYRVKQTGLKLLDPGDVVFPPVSAIPTDQLVRIFKHEDSLKAFISGCSKELVNRMRSGERPSGVKFVRSRTRRKINEETEGELQDRLASLGVPLHKMTLRGITDLKDALSEKRLTGKEIEALLQPFLVTPEGGIVLAKSDDKREEVELGQNLFIEEE